MGRPSFSSNPGKSIVVFVAPRDGTVSDPPRLSVADLSGSAEAELQDSPARLYLVGVALREAWYHTDAKRVTTRPQDSNASDRQPRDGTVSDPLPLSVADLSGTAEAEHQDSPARLYLVGVTTENSYAKHDTTRPQDSDVSDRRPCKGRGMKRNRKDFGYCGLGLG